MSDIAQFNNELLKDLSILVVDDDIYLAELLVEEFIAYGAQSERAGSGNEAFTMLQKKSYDIVISDMRMPDGDGKSLFLRVKQHFTGNAPLLFMYSGFKDVTDEEVIDLEILEMFAKPFNLRQMAETMLAHYQEKVKSRAA